MPRLQRAKASEFVAEHILEEFTTGRLRPGDRIDLEAVAEELGVSRAPVREAVIMLERDGTVRMPYHRGAFLGDITCAQVRESFTLYALLSGLTSELAARETDDDFFVEVQRIGDRALRSGTFEAAARDFRRVINRRVAGAPLRALLRTFTGMVVAVSALAIEADVEKERRLLAAEIDAILERDPSKARQATVDHIRDTGERGIAVLVEREILDEVDVDDHHGRRLPSIEALLSTMGGTTS